MQRSKLVKQIAKDIALMDNETGIGYFGWSEESEQDKDDYKALASVALKSLAKALCKMPIDQDGEHDITTELIDFFDGMDDEFDFGY